MAIVGTEGEHSPASVVCQLDSQRKKVHLGSKSDDLISMSFTYIAIIPGDCEANMQTFMEKLEKNDIGFSYTKHQFAMNTMFLSGLNKTPHIQRLAYPLMLAYGVLINSSNLSASAFVSEETSRSFLKYLTNSKYESVLKKLYGTELLETLRQRAHDIGLDEFISKDLLLRAADIIMRSECTSLEECPQFINDKLIIHWARAAGPHCALARAMYLMNYTPNMNEFGPIMWTEQQPLPSTIITLLHSTSFVADLIEDSRNVTSSGNLSEHEFDLSMRLCNVTREEVSHAEPQIVLPLTIMEKLVENDTLHWFKSDQLSSFAFILANMPAIKRAVCNENLALPSVQCEWVLHSVPVYFYRAYSPSLLISPSRQRTSLCINCIRILT